MMKLVSSQSELSAWFDVIHRAVSMLKEDVCLPTPRQSFHENFLQKQEIPRSLPPLPPRKENVTVEPGKESDAEQEMNRPFLQSPFLPLTASLLTDVSSLSVGIQEFTSTCSKSLNRLEDMEQRLKRLRQRLI